MMFYPTQFYVPYNSMNTLNAIHSLMPEQSQRVRFTKEEDELLKQLVNTQSQPNWNDISRYMKNRTARQCRERYNNYLRPNLINGPWTHEEDELLIELYEKHGPKWSFISQSFHARSPVNLKNHHSSLISKSAIKNRQNKVNFEHEETFSPEQPKTNQNVQIESNSSSSLGKMTTLNIQENNNEQSGENMFSNLQFQEDDLWSFSFMPKYGENVLAF